MGVKINAQTHHDHSYVLAAHRLTKLSFSYNVMPWLWLKFISKLTGYETQYKLNLKTVTDFTKSIIDSRRKKFVLEEANQPYAFLDLLLNMEKENKLTNEEIRDEIETIMLEG